MKILFTKKLLVAGILILAALFRFYNLNWDAGYHLHPDERFLVMVGTDIHLPKTFFDYLNPQVSTFNPVNIGQKFYVYGVFPVILNKLVSLILTMDTYDGQLYTGRVLSAFVELLTVIVIYKSLMLIKKHHKMPEEIVYYGTFFYAIAVLPIQLSHFYTVDTFLNFFGFTGFYLLIKYYYESKLRYFFMSALFFALALASKISAIYMFPLCAFFLLFTSMKKENRIYKLILLIYKKFSHQNLYIKIFTVFTISFISYGILIYIFLRLANPYYFDNQNFLIPKPNHTFIENIKILDSFNNKETTFPPSVQWLHTTPVLYSLYNLSLYGTGLLYFPFVITGLVFLSLRYRTKEMITVLLWITVFFLYQATRFSQPMRYFYVLYPFLAIAAGVGFYILTKQMRKIFIFCFLILTLFWPLCYLSIYIQPMTRVAASNWIYDNIAQDKIILGEHWDDALPFPKDGKSYRIELLPVFLPETTEKWKDMDKLLAQGDYLILTSNRGWGSIPKAQERYPETTKFYQDLFAGKSKYKKIKEFTSFPSLQYLGIPITIPDNQADESFTVYDHPIVMIFQKQ